MVPVVGANLRFSTVEGLLNMENVIIRSFEFVTAGGRWFVIICPF